MSGSARPPLTSLTSCAPASSANSATRRPHGVDGDGQPGPDQLGDDRADPAQLLGLVDALRPRPGRLAAHVHDVGALRPASSRPCAMAASAPYHWPPSENESGVTLTTPMTRQRSALGRPGRVPGGSVTAARRCTAQPSADLARTHGGRACAAIRRSSSRGQTRNASASSAASAILGASLVLGKTKNRGCQTGQNLALNLYSDSIWNHLDMKISTERQALSTGPAPIRSPRSSAARNTAKFSEMRFTPRPEAALMVSRSGSRSARAGRPCPGASGPGTGRRRPRGPAAARPGPPRSRWRWRARSHRRGADPAEGHREAALGLAAAPGIGGPDDGVELVGAGCRPPGGPRRRSRSWPPG